MCWYGRVDERRAHRRACKVVDASSELRVRLAGEAGWTFEIKSDQLVVAAVDEAGAAAKLNEQIGLGSDRKIRIGCIVTEVNSIRGDCHELLFLLEKASEEYGDYSVVLKQPAEFCTTIVRKQAKSYGLELGIHEVRSYLEIRAVMAEGAVMDHNCNNARESLKSDDRIVEVNGRKGSSKELLQRMQGSERCTLKICRPQLT